MVGGKDADFWSRTHAGRVNLATGAGGSGRQTGSAFKPFALVTALENGISPTPCSRRPPRSISRARRHIWHVTNAEGSGYGSMSLRARPWTR